MTSVIAPETRPLAEPRDLAFPAGNPHIPTLLLRDRCYLEVLIPARNEARRLPGTLRRTVDYLRHQEYSAAVVVIDNGSFDGTADVAAQLWSDDVPVHVVGCARPGKGAAVRRGILTSRAQFLGYMDADLATPIETLDVVMPLLDEHKAVVGSRRIRGAALARRQPVLRSIGGAVFNRMARRVLDGLTDTQCGFKFFDGNLARTVASQLSVDGFAFDVEMLQLISQLDVPIKEIPVVWSDVKGSTLNAVRDGRQAALDLYRLSRKRPR